MTIQSSVYRWYRQGTVAVTNGSTAVTGTTTAWTTNVKPGDGITFDGGASWYEIESVTDNTHLVLATNFGGSTASGVSYAIDRRSLAWQVGSEAAARVLALQEMLQQTLKTTGQPPDTIGSDGAVAYDAAAMMFYTKTGDTWDDGVSFKGELQRYGSITGGNVAVWQSDTQVKAVPNVSLNGSGWLGLGTDNPVAPVHIKGVAPGFFLEDTAFADNDAFFVYYAYNLSLQRRTSAGVYQGQPVTFDFRAPDNALVLGSTGNLRASAYGAGTLTTDASGNITASSDEALKEDIRPFTRGLPEILQVNPISHLWTAASGFDRMNRYAGFSAQNIETAIPEAVGVDANGYLTLIEKPILAALVNSVKTLSEQNAALAARIAALEQGA